jgi:hypothetical protein
MAINIYEPMRFSSQGIEDLATQPTLQVTNGKITVDVVEPTKALVFTANSFADLDGKGIKWSDGRKNKGLILKKDYFNSDLSINLVEDQDYKINNTSVLSFSELGNTVTKSNLKVLGTLKSLKVSGDSELGEFLYVNSTLNRVGINNDSPRMAISVKENGVEVGIGSIKNKIGVVGTFSHDSFEIVADSVARIVVQPNGEIKINGTLIVDQLVTDAHPLMIFKETSSNTNYGRGLLYAQLRGANKQFVLHAGPDRFWSTENIDLDSNKFYSIENSLVLSKTMLGTTVTESSLTKVGVLRELQVAGDAAIARRLSTNQIEVGRFVIDENKLSVNNDFSINRAGVEELSINNNIEIGNSLNRDRIVNLHGKVSIGGSNPVPGVSLSVNGAVSFDNKKFIVGTSIPTEGNFSKGDIVWNSDPKPTDYIGWVCVTAGSPGSWLPFGSIASR